MAPIAVRPKRFPLYSRGPRSKQSEEAGLRYRCAHREQRSELLLRWGTTQHHPKADKVVTAVWRVVAALGRVREVGEAAPRPTPQIATGGVVPLMPGSHVLQRPSRQSP